MIPSLGDAAVGLSRSLELAVLAKATLILLAALVVLRLARTARASARHLVVASAFASLLALPAVAALAPSVTIDVPVPAARPAISPPAVTPPPATVTPAPAGAAARSAAFPAVSVAGALRAVWLAGVIAFLLPVGIVLWRLFTIRRTGVPVAWCRDELAALARARGVTQSIEVLEHESVPGPMTFGVLRPVIVLPADAREWSETELRCALMHEIEHIQRRDWLTQTAARAVAACYWFHPMVWTAWRRLCLEAERACDDAVVLSEERTEYAEQLVSLAARMSATPLQPLLGMANRSDLSARVTAVLDDRLRRGRAGALVAAGTVVAAGMLVLAVAPVRAVATTPALAVVEDADDAEDARGADPAEQRARARDAALRQSARTRDLDTALYEAALAGDLEGVREMIGAGADANARILGDGSPLIGAARSGRLDIARLLLDHGADPNLTVPGDGSALIVAAARGRLDQVQLLVQHGADVNLAVEGDENPLMGAAEGGHLAVVQYLVERGADVHARIWNVRFDGGGEWRTALSQASRNRHAAVVRYLESLGAR
jgi:beta-lactamase regulating signal transducer with metallopeptidase domain